MSDRVEDARTARDRLRTAAEPDRAEKLAWFFKAGPGGYGEGDRFHGVRVPGIRHIAKVARSMPMAEVGKLLRSPFHEERLLALFLLVHRYEKGDADARAEVFEVYLSNLDHVNNWDLVDASAHRIIGAHLRNTPDRRLLYRLARSAVLWERRIAIIATFAFIMEDDFEDALALAEHLLEDDEDLVHKAVGWMLREVGKRDVARLERFLQRHHADMPRTMLRYAIERLPPATRDRYMGKPTVRRRTRRDTTQLRRKRP